LLAFSRKQVLTPQVLDLNAVVLKSKQMLDHILTNGIGFETTLSDSTGKVLIDPTQMEQVILNLVVNARDAVEKTSGSVTLKTQELEVDEESAFFGKVPPGRYISLSVIDTGIG